MAVISDLNRSAEDVMHAQFAPFLAEVSDKMNSWPAVIAWVAGISAASVVTLRKRSWLAVIPGLLALLWAWGACDILADRFMRTAVVVELGVSYILIEFIPLAVFAVFLLLEMKSSPNKRPDRASAKAPPSDPSRAVGARLALDPCRRSADLSRVNHASIKVVGQLRKTPWQRFARLQCTAAQLARGRG